MSDPTVRKRPTAADVGREAGVSRATVGFVFNNTPGQTISPATRKRVLDAADRIGYRPHAGAQALARGASRIVLLVLPNWPVGHSVQRFIEAADSVLDAAGYTLVTYTPRHDGSARPLWELLEPEVVMGFAPFDEQQLTSMRAQGISHIFPDERGGGEAREVGPIRQLSHLHELGHRHVAYASTADPRLAELAEARISSAEQHAVDLQIPSLAIAALDDTQDATRAVEHWRASGITAVAAYNDEIAALVVGAASRLGISIPHELSVIGHDDAPIAALFVPALTSVRRDEEADGRNFASVAVASATGSPIPTETSEVFEEVVVRESTAPPGS